MSNAGSATTTKGQDRFWASITLLAAVILVARSAPAVRVYNHTFDEPYHLGAAMAIYETGAPVMGVQHGPLPRLVAGLPLFLAGDHFPMPDVPRKIRSESLTFSFGADLLFKGTVPYWRALTLSRLAMLVVFPPVCLWYVFLLGRWLAGPRAGGAAAVFFSLDPTLLGHSFWVCTDVAGCAGFLFSLYHGLRWLARPTARTACVAGVAIGLAISCKFSCLLVLPALVVLAAVGVGHRSGPGQAAYPGRRFLTIKQIAVVTAAAFVSLWATYLFTVGKLNNQNLLTAAELARVPRIFTRPPVPMPSFWLGVYYLFKHDQEGHPSYLNGHLGDFGHWYYFPEALGLKEPVSLLVVVALALVIFACVRSDRLRWRPVAAVMVPAAIFLAVAMHGHLNLGVRHVLPVIPCLYLLVAIVLVGDGPDPVSRTAPGRWRPIVLAFLIGTTLVETVPCAPDYISYFNVLAGGPRGGERYLIDSNLDWGQDQARLADYIKSPGVAGRPYTMRLFNVRVDELNSVLGLRPAAAIDTPAGLFAVSVNVRKDLFRAKDSQDPPKRRSDWNETILSRYPVVARIGTSINVYDLDKPK